MSLSGLESISRIGNLVGVSYICEHGHIFRIYFAARIKYDTRGR